MFKVNNKETSGVFIVNFEHIPHLALVFLLLTLWKNIGFEDELFRVFLMNFFCICCKTKALTMCISKSTFFSFKPDRIKKNCRTASISVSLF